MDDTAPASGPDHAASALAWLGLRRSGAAQAWQPSMEGSRGRLIVADTCSNCSQLESELATAKREIQTLRYKVRRMQRAIELARAACRQYMAQTQAVLSQKSGVPKGQWVYARGAWEVAARLAAILSSGGES